MSKKVFILGIGGSGSRVASLIANKQLNNVDRIISLAIDTDIKELNEIQNISKIQITNMETVSQTVERIGSEKISNWFPIGEEYSTQFLKTIDMHKGSHLWRMQALLALNDYLLNEEKKLELTTIIDEMFKDEDAEFDFYVVTSLCGGTGSGIYLPLSFYIKNYVKEKYKLNIKFNLVLNCPDVYIDSISGDLKTKAYANAYASLQELNNVIEVANGYNQKAMKNYQTIIDFKLYLGDEIIYNSTDSKYYDIKSLPFNQILLFDKIPSIIGVGNHESILSSLISMLITRIKEESTTQNKNMLSSIFMTKITYPYQSNIDYILIKKTYDEISKQWLNFYNYINNQKELRKNDVYEFVPKYNKVNFEADKLLDVLDILEDNENFDEFVLNRVHEKDKNNLVEYYKDNENYVIEEFRKKLQQHENIQF